MSDIRYAGFWIRTLAAIIDSILIMVIITPILLAIYGDDYFKGSLLYKGTWDLLLNYLFPAIAIMVFWFYKSATPGKMVLHLKIVDAKTLGKPSVKQLIIRYLGYYVSALPFLMGIMWVGVDERKQGWHDKLAGTLVIKEPS
ncbi:RDD family protein [Maricurvus nonylphenolicus]|uniref:RDD family protein n=1 Tax=Maricurvus nonylphenolicus TaxID=1008307 RepID=UPI0036F1D8BF